MSRPEFARRHRARELAAQALYQYQLNASTAADIVEQFIRGNPPKSTDLDYFRQLVEKVISNWKPLTLLLEPLLDRSASALDPVERGLLLLGAHELEECQDIPCRVVINEGVKLAKAYGATESHKFVNSVLDRLARELRPDEFGD